MPIITISRLYGSGGSEVAARVAEQLGWTLLDNAVVDAVAERLGAAPSEVAAREERVPSLVERLANALALSTAEMLSPLGSAKMPPTEESVLEMTHRVIDEAIARGPVVIVGRGAQEMLRAREDSLAVFCYAPRDALIRRSMARDNLSAEQAAKLVDDTNKRREEWVKRHWNRAWRAPEHYDICVNTQALGVDGAARVIIGVATTR